MQIETELSLWTKKSELLRQIDESLDEGDKIRFKILAKALILLESSTIDENHQPIKQSNQVFPPSQH